MLKLCFNSTANYSVQPKSFNMAKFATALCLLIAVAGIQGDLSSSMTEANSMATTWNETVTTKYTSVNSKLDEVTATSSDNVSTALAQSAYTAILTLTDALYNLYLTVISAFNVALTTIESFNTNNTATNATNCAINYTTKMTTDFNTTVSDMSDFLDDLYEMAETASACTTNACMSGVASDATENTSEAFSSAMDGGSDFIDAWGEVLSLLESCASGSD